MKIDIWRKMLVLMAIIVIPLSLTGCGGAGAVKDAVGTKAAPVKIKLASQPGHFQSYIADELGFFKDEGLDVEVVTFSYGPPMIEAFTAGAVDFGLLGAGIANGLDISIVGVYSAGTQLQGIAVRDDAQIKSLADLKGKKVAVAFGSNLQPFLYLLLEKGGLTDKDLEIINLGMNDGVTSLIKGDIAADVASEPNLSKAAAPGNGVTVLQRSEGIKLFVSPIIARNEFLKNHPEESVKVLKALARAGEWAKTHKEEAVKIANKKTEADINGLSTRIAKDNLSIALNDEKIEALVKGAKDAYKYGLLKKDLDIKKYIDTTFLAKAGIEN